MNNDIKELLNGDFEVRCEEQDRPFCKAYIEKLREADDLKLKILNLTVDMQNILLICQEPHEGSDFEHIEKIAKEALEGLTC